MALLTLLLEALPRPNLLLLLPRSRLQGQEALSQHQAISEALASGSAADVGRALLAAERLLGEAGRLSDEWGDVWQLPWCRWGPGGRGCTAWWAAIAAGLLAVASAIKRPCPVPVQPGAGLCPAAATCAATCCCTWQRCSST